MDELTADELLEHAERYAREMRERANVAVAVADQADAEAARLRRALTRALRAEFAH